MKGLIVNGDAVGIQLVAVRGLSALSAAPPRQRA